MGAANIRRIPYLMGSLLGISPVLITTVLLGDTASSLCLWYIFYRLQSDWLFLYSLRYAADVFIKETGRETVNKSRVSNKVSAYFGIAVVAAVGIQLFILWFVVERLRETGTACILPCRFLPSSKLIRWSIKTAIQRTPSRG
jgi:hypothetical protein